MKIGILSREYPPLTHVGGIATFSAAAASLLASHGHEVHVVCSGTENRIHSEGGITVHRIVMLPHHFPTNRIFFLYRSWYRKRLPHYLEALTWARTAARYLSTGLDTRDFDIWEYPETGGEGALFPLPAPGRRPRLISRIHTSWMDAHSDNWIERTLLIKLQRTACLKADCLVSPSASMAGDYIQKTLGVGKPVVVSRNPFSLWEKPIDWESKKMNHLLFVGRVEYRKGLQTLLQALDEMGEAAKGLTLRVVGHMHAPTRDVDRRCLEYFQAHLDNRAGTGNYTLEYAGPAAHADMPGHYDWAGIQVMPSLMDNYPYVALEGLSRGCFVIGSEVGGIPEIIDRPERGLLFASENSTQLAEKIRECRRREQEISEGRRKMAEEIRSEFALESCYRRLMEVYGADLSQRTQG